jgi:hypothetical protein
VNEAWQVRSTTSEPEQNVGLYTALVQIFSVVDTFFHAFSEHVPAALRRQLFPFLSISHPNHYIR